MDTIRRFRTKSHHVFLVPCPGDSNHFFYRWVALDPGASRGFFEQRVDRTEAEHLLTQMETSPAFETV